MRRGNHVPCGALVGRVLVRVQETHRDRLDAGGGQFARLAANLILVDRHDGVAVAADALVDLAAQVARRQGLGKLEEQIVDVVSLLSSHLEGIAEAPGGQQRQLDAAALDDGVGHQRRPVHQVADVGEGETGFRQQGLETFERPDRRILGRGQTLVDAHRAGVCVDEDEIGEGAADIQADAIAIRHGCHVRSLPGSGSAKPGNAPLARIATASAPRTFSRRRTGGRVGARRARRKS